MPEANGCRNEEFNSKCQENTRVATTDEGKSYYPFLY